MAFGNTGSGSIVTDHDGDAVKKINPATAVNFAISFRMGKLPMIELILKMIMQNLCRYSPMRTVGKSVLHYLSVDIIFLAGTARNIVVSGG